MLKNSALVLVADKAYLEHTKQLFYCAHHYGNWAGDHVLLGCNLAEDDCKWFKERNIHVVNPPPLINRKVNGWPPAVFQKFYLLHPMMQKWEKLVYLDTDIIIQRDINHLVNYSSFAACNENGKLNIRGQLLPNEKLSTKGKELIGELKKKYNIGITAFNVGLMVIPTSQNSISLFEEAREFLFKYEEILYLPEQALFNLLFYKKWQKIPQVYNDYFFYEKQHVENSTYLQVVKGHSRILHFIGDLKPWDPYCYHHDLWKANLAMANQLPHIEQIGENPDKWTLVLRLLKRYLLVLKLFFGHISWLVGQGVQKVSPPLYLFLKRMVP